MLELLNNKIIIIFAIFGAALALILSMLAKVFILDILIRTFIGGLIMGIIGFGLDFFLKQALSEEDYDSLMNAFRFNNNEIEEKPKYENKLDITDKSDGDPSYNYSSIYKEESDDKYDNDQNKTAINEAIDPIEKSEISQSFKPDSIDDIPKINTIENQEDEPVYIDEKKKGIKEDLTKLGNVQKEEQFKQAANTGDSVKFKVGNKNVTADPKIIAKAIKTVMHRE